MSKRCVIWSNICLDSRNLIEEIREDYPGLSDLELYEKLMELNYRYLEDVRIELDIQLSQPILVIAEIGRWNARRFNGYKEIASGNVRDCLYSDTDLTEWYVDKLGDLRADAISYCGTNHYLYRVYKDSATEEQREKLREKIVFSKATRKDITSVTERLEDKIAEVYGFDISKKRKEATV